MKSHKIKIFILFSLIYFVHSENFNKNLINKSESDQNDYTSLTELDKNDSKINKNYDDAYKDLIKNKSISDKDSINLISDKNDVEINKNEEIKKLINNDIEEKVNETDTKKIKNERDINKNDVNIKLNKDLIPNKKEDYINLDKDDSNSTINKNNENKLIKDNNLKINKNDKKLNENNEKDTNLDDINTKLNNKNIKLKNKKSEDNLLKDAKLNKDENLSKNFEEKNKTTKSKEILVETSDDYSSIKTDYVTEKIEKIDSLLTSKKFKNPNSSKNLKDKTNEMKTTTKNDLSKNFSTKVTTTKPNETFTENNLNKSNLNDEQLIIDGYQNINVDKLFILDEFINLLKKQSKLNVKIKLICMTDLCDQKTLTITTNKLILKYELIKQNIFLDIDYKNWNYLNCFYIQYNPNYGLRSYLRNNFTFNSKKAFINICSEDKKDGKDEKIISGKIYLTNDFDKILDKYQSVSNILKIEFENEEYFISFDQEETISIDKTNILKNIYNSIDKNINETESTLIKTYNQILDILKNKKNLLKNKLKFLNQLNSTLFNDGLHQKLNNLKFLKAEIILDDGLLTTKTKDQFDLLNHFFQLIYEIQVNLKQINFNFVVTRLRTKLTYNLRLLTGTNHKLDVNYIKDEVFKLKTQQNNYYKLDYDITIFLTSFKFFYSTTANLIPSYSFNTISSHNPLIILQFKRKKNNLWGLLIYELGHILGLKDDNHNCECFSGLCVMDNKNYLMTNNSFNLDELTWSNCSLLQLQDNLKKLKSKFNLEIEKTVFKIDSFNETLCGNGVLEINEDCDCGKFGCFYSNQENLNLNYSINQCCDPLTCKLKEKNFQCASGSCCNLDKCTYRNNLYVCRPKQDICDIEETCTGFTPYCPNDDYYVNGESCESNGFCLNKRCKTKKNVSNCKKYLNQYAFETDVCKKHNMVANDLYNCGFSIAENRWISCRSIEQARCGSLLCAVEKKYLNSNASKNFNNKLIIHKTGQSYNSSHECVLLAEKNLVFSYTTKVLPIYPVDGTNCGSNKFCNNKKCIKSDQLTAYSNCYHSTNCSEDQKCTYLNYCRCDLSESKDFDFNSSYYCNKPRSLNSNRFNNQGFLKKFNLYHLLIIPCFGVVLVLAGFLRSYLRSGVYKIRSSEEMSVSFSGPRPSAIWLKPCSK